MTSRLARPRGLTFICCTWLIGCGAAPQAQTATSAQSTNQASRTGAPRPRLVLSVVIDQLGSDTLRKLEPLLASDGAFAKARERGVIYERVVYPYAATLTAPGHAAVYTGATPSESGVTGNYLVDRATGKRRAFVDDGEHPVIGVADEFVGPGPLRVPTVGDALKAATDGRGKVVSLALKDRSAVLPAGKRPDLVLWYEPELKGFTTSTYYATALPDWLVSYQDAHPIKPESISWQAEAAERLEQLLGPDRAKGEGALPGFKSEFPYALADSPTPFAVWPYLPAAAERLLDLAFEGAKRLALGTDDDPDLLAISISSTDYTGHIFGPDSWEYADHLVKVDRALGRLIEQLSQYTTLAVLITSDHGGAPLPERAKAEHPGAARLDPKALAVRLDAAVDAVFGAGDWVAGYFDTYVFLTPAARAHPGAARIRATVLGALRAEPGIATAFDCVDTSALVRAGGALEQAVLRSIHPDGSGDLYVVTAEYVVPDIGIAKDGGTTHGSPYPYDTDVPVLLLAPGLAPARLGGAFDQRQIASTLAALLGVRAPHPNAPAPLPGLAAAPVPPR